ncbi:hypothetical protein D3C85_1071650 [compost metagenome]
MGVIIGRSILRADAWHGNCHRRSIDGGGIKEHGASVEIARAIIQPFIAAAYERRVPVAVRVDQYGGIAIREVDGTRGRIANHDGFRKRRLQAGIGREGLTLAHTDCGIQAGHVGSVYPGRLFLNDLIHLFKKSVVVGMDGVHHLPGKVDESRLGGCAGRGKGIHLQAGLERLYARRRIAVLHESAAKQ